MFRLTLLEAKVPPFSYAFDIFPRLYLSLSPPEARYLFTIQSHHYKRGGYVAREDGLGPGFYSFVAQLP